jgi:hypothetical protein
MTDELKIVKEGTCPTVSGASNLAYEIGSDADGALHFRITGNTGGGLFGKEWVAWSVIQPVLETDQPITAGTLKRAGVCKGKSANTPGFLLAVLKAEGLVTPLEQGGHTKADPADFLAAMSAKPTRRTKPR